MVFFFRVSTDSFLSFSLYFQNIELSLQTNLFDDPDFSVNTNLLFLPNFTAYWSTFIYVLQLHLYLPTYLGSQLKHILFFSDRNILRSLSMEGHQFFNLKLRGGERKREAVSLSLTLSLSLCLSWISILNPARSG